MDLTNKIIKDLGFEFIDSPVKDDLARGPRWENHHRYPMSNFMLAVDGPGCWRLFINGHNGSSIRTVEHLISRIYEQGIQDGIIEVKKFLKEWIGY
jgi:hypothetical protein